MEELRSPAARLPGSTVFDAWGQGWASWHRGEHEAFGWASARFDDLLNLPGARLSGLLAATLAPVVGGSPSAALGAWRRDARRHPSPNAGVVEAAFAGALGRTLGGPLAYAGRVEDRPLLGDGPAPRVDPLPQSELD